MSQSFRKGVHYNMKIVLRGDVMTGKSNLFHRLQGAEFNENYLSTPQIEVANIPWHYKDSNDIVKIEVWDVVDKAHNKTVTKTQGIKLDHNEKQKEQQQQEEDNMGLDASTVNVYRNSHAALFLFDITKPWTFDYVDKELENVPETMSVLVLGNFCDKVKDRKVDLDEIHATLYQHNQERIRKGAIKPNLIRYAETSMESGMGLKYIYDYLGVPFLQLMIESIKKQLELKAIDIVDLLEELDANDDVPESMQRRRAQDNFNQPSEPRIARQQEQLESEWDQDLQDIAADHSTLLDDTLSFNRGETPPPPTAPVSVSKLKNKEMDSFESQMVPNAEPFEVGDDHLEEDWFGDDTPDINNQLLSVTTKNQDSDDDDTFRGNPMVAGDEDVESVEYYSQRNVHASIEEQNVVLQKMSDHEQEEEVDQEEEDIHAHYQPPVFKSELNDVWSTSYQRMSGPQVVSESEDEDNKMIQRVESPFSPGGNSNPSDGFGYGAYEEIGGGSGVASSSNPWSNEQVTQPWDGLNMDSGVEQKEEEEESHVQEQPVEQPMKDVQTESKPKKNKSSKKRSNKKKNK
ncbi:P-loop containing nucleoside triphosphate hydrolase protein [Backusella circina FSU 941]|nr:P-loop containing nucleoside triphosphate hydrolase protein [Backusella circina FSU 941]